MTIRKKIDYSHIFYFCTITCYNWLYLFDITKLHKVFETSFDLKVIRSEKLIRQKINYIHRNPVSKRWKLVDDFKKYQLSSAGFYVGDADYKGYPVIHYREVFD